MSPVPSRVAVAVALLGGCTTTGTAERVEPTFLQVELLDAETGTAEEPLAFTSEETTVALRITALDVNADPTGFDGDLKLSVRPGRLDSSPWVTVTDGVVETELTFHSAYGPTRIWAADEGDRVSDSERVSSWATGVSEPVFYTYPTISEMQRHEDTETNQLDKEFARLRLEDRQAVVTTIGVDGFWVTDISDADGDYNSLFVYTFSVPVGIDVGSRLTELTGNNQEYLATTQLSFPTYSAAEDETLTPPDPVAITATTSCDDAAMEGLESSVVVLEDATIPSDFVDGSDEYADFLEYGQWPVELGDGSCRLYVSGEIEDGFYPPDHAGESIDEIEGLVTQIFSMWVITTRSDSVGTGGGDGSEDERRQKHSIGKLGPSTSKSAPRRPAPRDRDGVPDRGGLDPHAGHGHP